MHTIEADYLVVGAGAMAMAFIDALVAETSVTSKAPGPARPPSTHACGCWVTASVADLFARLEEAGLLLRIDPAIRPAMYRCATVTRLELEQLRRIIGVVRMGHLLAVEADKMILDRGVVAVSGRELYLDCTADGAEKRPATSIFDAGRITLQSVRGCQQIFSAALIAHVEAAYVVVVDSAFTFSVT